MTTDRNRSDEASTTTALLLAAGVLLSAGLALAVAGEDETALGEDPASLGDEQAYDLEPESHDVDWLGHIAVDACAPTGPNSCSGATLGDARERYDTRTAQDVEQANLELTWESDTPDTEELELRLASGHVERCSDRATCYFWTTHASAVGTSPLTLDASDVPVDDGDTLWILVDAPDLTPDPLHSDVHTFQHFHVTGEIQPAADTDGQTTTASSP